MADPIASKSPIEPLALNGRVVTADALHTQRETARFLVEDKQAHYLLTVKENQPTLYADLKALSPAQADPGQLLSLNRGHCVQH